jgi:hypothetical protein
LIAVAVFIFAQISVSYDSDLANFSQSAWQPGDGIAGLNCDPVPPGCICCEFGTGLGATLEPVDDFDGFLEHAIPSGTILPPGTVVYPTALVGNTYGGNQCDGCSGSVRVTYPDGSDFTIEHGPFPLGSASELEIVVISFPGWTLTQDVPPANCFSTPVCCPNTFYSYAEGILVQGEGTATTGWPVLTAQPDLNGDGLVNVQDIIEVIVNWDEPAGDCGCDGEGGVNDLMLILDHWSET